MENASIDSAVIITGIVVGSLAMCSAIWVWAKKQQFGYAGSLLSFFGTLLIGLSVFSKAQISIGEVQILVERLQQEVSILEASNENIAKENDIISSQVVKLAENVKLQRKGVLTLGRAIAEAEDPSTRPPAGNWLIHLERAEVPDSTVLRELIESHPTHGQPDTGAL